MTRARLLLASVACTALLVALVIIAVRSQRVLAAGLPPRTEHPDAKTAWDAAFGFARESGGNIVTVLGTGSMRPYIPAAGPGRAPLETITALAVTAPGASFDSVTPGALCLYKHAASAVGVTMHGAALLTSAGWKMSGLHNARSDITMTPETFVGIVAHVFVWPQ